MLPMAKRWSSNIERFMSGATAPSGRRPWRWSMRRCSITKPTKASAALPRKTAARLEPPCRATRPLSRHSVASNRPGQSSVAPRGSAAAPPARWWARPPRQPQRDQAERHHHVEDRAPTRQPTGHAAGQQPPVATAREQPGGGEHGHRHGGHEARADPLGALLAQRKVLAHVGDGHVDDGGRHDRRHRAHHHREQQQPTVALAVAQAQGRDRVVARSGWAHGLRNRWR
jgi:hypothetical protein